MPPADLVHYVTGNDADADVTPTGPGLILMGGGTDVDAAFLWWKPRITGGDVVVLRASGADGYNDYLYKTIGGCDSVETLLVTSKELANDPYVLSRVTHAEAIFMAGGDQANYANFWRGTALVDAIHNVWARGGIVGGTSAGSAVLGEYYFAAYEGSVVSTEALQDPYNMYMTVDRDFFVFSPLAGFITDSHFATRDRMGRLVGFLARIITDGWAPSAKGIGIDEETAIVIDATGKGEILGVGKAYLVNANQAPTVCTAGKPLEYTGLSLHRIGSSDTLQFPSGVTSAPAEALDASGGMLSIANPY
jgi:cyanophycinase